MGRIVQPGYSQRDDGSNRRRKSGGVAALIGSYLRIIREYGLRGIVALVTAGVLAFAPVGVLVYFNVGRFAPVVRLKSGQTVVVKPSRNHDDRERDEAGATGVLVVTCDVPWVGQPRPLLAEDDPYRDRAGLSDAPSGRHDQVYVRPAAEIDLPFGLLGSPPVSAWLPEGEYEVLVVYEAPTSESRVDSVPRGFPFLTVRERITLEKFQKTRCNLYLPHHSSGAFEALATHDATGSGTTRSPTTDELRPIFTACTEATAVPTLGGYLLTLPQPSVVHTENHTGCLEEYTNLNPLTREWTREQLATLRNWLPEEAGDGRDRLSQLVNRLQWREFFQGWYCYAAAGLTGLIFTNWGATAMLEPWRRRQAFGESVGLCVSIFLLSAIVAVLFQAFFN
jgi:hypothetical protein